MTKITASFENQKVYIGLDVHKRSWTAAVYLNDQFIRNIHQPPTPQALHHYLIHTYPGATYVCAYKSGKFGYRICREFKQCGITCFLINPADIPSTHKDEVYKTDGRDAPGIGHALVCNQLKGIYVPTEEQEAYRYLVRQRKKIWRCRLRKKGGLLIECW